MSGTILITGSGFNVTVPGTILIVGSGFNVMVIMKNINIRYSGITV